MKDGSYSTTPIKSAQGYHIVYRTSQDEKPELNEELTKTITEYIYNQIKGYIEIIFQEILHNDSPCLIFCATFYSTGIANKMRSVL